METNIKSNLRLRHFQIECDEEATGRHYEIIDDFISRGVDFTMAHVAKAILFRPGWATLDFHVPEYLADEYQRRLTSKPRNVETSVLEVAVSPAINGNSLGKTPKQVEAIIARVKQADGTDRDLDWDIAEALGGNVRRVSGLGLSGRTAGSNRVFWPHTTSRNGSAIPYYTKDRKKAVAKLETALQSARMMHEPTSS